MSNLMRSLIMSVMVAMSHLLICALAAGVGNSGKEGAGAGNSMVAMSHLLIYALAAGVGNSGKEGAGTGNSDERSEIPPALDDQTEYYPQGEKYVTLPSENQPKVNNNNIIWPNGNGGRGLGLLRFEAARKLTVADAKRRVPAGPDPLHHSGHSNKKNP